MHACRSTLEDPTSLWQFESKVAALTDGGFVVTWMSTEQDGSEYGIFAQRFSADGTPVGGEFQVNTFTDGMQDKPDIAGLADGGWVITWQSWDEDDRGVFGQRYDADGNPVGSGEGGGESGANTLMGGKGNDTYNVQADDSVTDVLDGVQGGKDLVNATLEDGQAFALGEGTGLEDLTLLGDGGTIEGSGNALNNRITGAADASNHLSGGAGKDTLTGGDASDILTGGSGKDQFRFGSASDDVITDFERKGPGGSKDALDLKGLTDGLPHSLTWLVSNGYLGVDSTADVGGGAAKDTVVWWDADGSAGELYSAAMVVTLLDVTLGTSGADNGYWMV